jgi:hypothetical protein
MNTATAFEQHSEEAIPIVLRQDSPNALAGWIAAHKRTQRTPEESLILAILEDAIDTHRLGARLGGNGKHRQSQHIKRIEADVETWIFHGGDSEWAFSFESCCEVLGLNPSAVRRQLRGERLWHHKHS